MSIHCHDTLPAVTIEHHVQDELVVASIDWPLAQPQDTYTIDAAPHLSLELDRHFPVRPLRTVLTDIYDEESLVIVERCLGTDLARAMRVAPDVGFCTLRLALSEANRYALANVQLVSPSSPPLLRRACRGILKATAGVDLANR